MERNVKPNPRILVRVGIAIALLALAVGCSKSTKNQAQDQAPTRYGSADTSGTAQAPAQSPAQAPAPTQAPADQTAPQKQVQQARHPRSSVVPAGTHVVASLDSPLSTASARSGDKVTLSTVDPVAADGRTIIPAGSRIDGEVTYAKGAGRIGGAPALTLRFSTVVLPDGHTYPIACEPFRVVGKSDRKQSLEEFGGGAAAGAAVGALLGKGRGALEGAAIGGILGTGVAVATKGHQIELPAGQRISVDLTAPLTLPTGG